VVDHQLRQHFAIDQDDFVRNSLHADIGGAHGAMLHALLRVHPHLQGIVFDRPNVIASASAAASESGLQDELPQWAGISFSVFREPISIF